MPTYVYETIPQQSGERARRFEVEQRMTEKALTHDPETGLPVTRVISGGLGVFTSGGDDLVPCASGGCMVPKPMATKGCGHIGPCSH